MRLDCDFGEGTLTYLITVLCHHGDRGDFQAFPTRNLTLDVAQAGRRLKASGALRARLAGGRLLFDWRNAAVTWFSSGRMMIENVRPDRTERAAEIIAEVLENALGERRREALGQPASGAFDSAAQVR